MKCVFCDLFSNNNQSWIIHRNELSIAFLPLEMECYGHTLISPFMTISKIPS